MHTLVKAGIGGLAVAGLLNADMAISAPTAATGVIVTSVVAGNIDPTGKVPVFNGVPGANPSYTNFDIPMPVAVLQHGVTYYYTVMSQNTTFNGTCKDSFKLTQIQGGVPVTLDSGIIVKSYGCGPLTQWGWVRSGKPVPNSPGPATLIGTVTYGTSKVSMAVHVVIQ